MQLFAASGGEQRLRRAFGERLRYLCQKGLGLRSLESQKEIGAGAELAGAGEATVDQLGGELFRPFGKRAGKKDNRVDARHLEKDGLACLFSGSPETKTGIPASGKADGAHSRIAHEFEPVFIADVVDQLDRRWRKSGLFDGLESLFGQQPGRIGMKRMSLCDDRIAGRDGGGEVASADTVEGEGKVVRAEDDDWADRREAGADVLFKVECCVTPRFLTCCSCSLAKLIRSARKLNVFEPWSHRESSLFSCGRDDGGSGGFNVRGIGFEESGDLCRFDVAEFCGSLSCCGEC